MDTIHFKKLENMYLKAPTNQYYSPTIKIGNGTAEVSLMIKPDFFHSGGAVHGSVYFKALDDAAYFAVNSMVNECLLVTISFNLHLIRPVAVGLVKAEGRITQYGKKISFAESVLLDERGRLIAKGSGTFMRSEKLLCEGIGYV